MTKTAIFALLTSKLEPIRVREIILAIEGYKVSRTLVNPEDLIQFIALMDACGVYTAVHNKKYHYQADWGKGGWVSRYGYEVSLESDFGSCMVYIANQPEKALHAMKSEHMQHDDEFGLNLGIPSCCREHYIRSIHLAETKQNDYLLITLNSTTADFPFDPWTNVAAQYFGYSLLSFYPCSFTCTAAAKHSRLAYKLLSDYSQSFADLFLTRHKMNYIYTEYDGIFQFPESDFKNGVLHYDATKLHTTLDSVISSVFRRGHSIQIEDRHRISIYDNDCKLISILEHEDLGVLIFKG